MPPVMDDSFRAPRMFEQSECRPRGVLIIGSCVTMHLAGYLGLQLQIPSDFVHIGQVLDSLPPPKPFTEYDLAIINVPLDFVFRNPQVPLRYSDRQGYEDLFNECCSRCSMYTELLLEWGEPADMLRLVCNFMVPQHNPMGRFMPRYELNNLVYFIERLNEHLTDILSKHRDTFLLDLDALSACVGRSRMQDDAFWPFWHGGYITDYDFEHLESKRTGQSVRLEPLPRLSEVTEFPPTYCTRFIWSEALAMYRTMRGADQIKLVAIDLDDTVWRGVPAESEELDRSFLTTGWPSGLVESLAYLHRRGVLLAVISKGDEERARHLWAQIYENLFPWEAFTFTAVNWSPKPANMKKLLEAVALGEKSVLFIDDNPVEREAMKAAFPQIRVSGGEAYGLRRALLWAPELQTTALTTEAEERTHMIQGQLQREAVRESISYEQFLETLDLRVEHRTITAEQDPAFARAKELLNRTNQFNTTGKRWTDAQLSTVLEAGGFLIILQAQDRFTNYGIVFVAVCRKNEIIQTVMSCRTIGIGVETAGLCVTSKEMAKRGEIELFAAYEETKWNELSRHYLARHGFEPAEGGWVIRSLDQIQCPAHIEVREKP